MWECWKELTGRQRVALWCFGAGLVLMVVSLPLPFLRGWPVGYGAGTVDLPSWKVLGGLGIYMGTEPEIFVVDSWSEFVEGPLPAIGLLLSYALMLPGLFLLFLASRSAWFCWIGRLVWTMLIIVGPLPALLISNWYNDQFGIGFTCWLAWLLLVSVSQWVVAPRRRSEVGGR